MAKAPTSKLSPAEQHKRFVETARELGCDESKEAFEAKLGRIARRRPISADADTTIAPKRKRAKPA